MKEPGKYTTSLIATRASFGTIDALQYNSDWQSFSLNGTILDTVLANSNCSMMEYLVIMIMVLVCRRPLNLRETRRASVALVKHKSEKPGWLKSCFSDFYYV
jgi:hypothetical protein